MAINENNEGRMVFDPSKRIRVALGEEFTTDLQADATRRLAAAMASASVIRSPGELEIDPQEENMKRLRDIHSKITHTNPIKPNPVQNEVPVNHMENMEPEERAKTRSVAFMDSERECSKLIEKKSFVENVVRKTTGFGIHDSATENVAHAIALGLKNFASCASADAIETTFRMKNDKNVGIAVGVSAGVDAIVTSWTAGNGARISKIFDPDVITSTEAQNISKTIAKEKVKYGIQHAVAAVVAPAVVKYGINKCVGEKIENNKVAQVLTSFGALSEVGKVTLNLVRRAKEAKASKEAAENVSITDSLDTPVTEYNNIAKHAINRIINESVDDTVFGTVLGSIIGYKSVEYVSDPVQNTTANKISEYMNSVEKPVDVPKVKTEEPKVKSVEEPKVKPAASSTKKSA